MLATGAQAQVECSGAGPHYVPSNWDLKPSGLSGGDSFRLLFVTSTTRNARATDIATYNTFVQTGAKAGHSAITDSCGDQFKVVGSTSAVDARDNTLTTGAGQAIYWLNGAKVADNYADFYDGSWDSYAGKTQAGTNFGGNRFVWTGSNQGGTKKTFRGNSLALGANAAEAGELKSGKNPIDSDFDFASSQTRSFYALSPIFTVQTTVSISAPTDANEGNSGQMTKRFTVTLSPAPSAVVTVRVCYSGTATQETTGASAAGDDYIALFGSSSTLASQCANRSIPAKTASGTWYGMRIYGDTTVEPDETVIATLSLVNPPAGVILGTATATYTILDDDNSPPTVDNTIPDQTAPAGTAFSYQFPANTFNDADSDVLTYTATKSDDTALPSWLAFDANTRTFSGTPQAANIGTVSVKVTADDSNGGTVSDTFNIVVSDTTAPSVTSIERQTPSSSPTNADSLTWRVTFSEAVVNVNAADFMVSGTDATLTVAPVTSTNDYDYDVTASGGNLAGLDGTVTLSFNSNHDIQDTAGNELADSPTLTGMDNSFVVQNTSTLSLSFGSTSGNEGNSGSTYVTVNIGLYPAYSGLTQFLLCVKNTGTATFRNASGSEAADFDLVNVNNDTGLPVNAENCHNYNISGGFDISSVRLRIFGDSVAEGNETAVLELRRRSVTPNDVVISATANLATYTITNDDGPDTTVPSLTSITRQTPSTSPTNADSLTWRVIFSEAVKNVNAADFTLTGPNASTVLTVKPVSRSETTTYDVTASGGNLAGLDGTVTLSFNSNHNIQDTAGNDLADSPTPTTGTNENSFVVQNTPTLSLSLASASGNEGNSGNSDVNVTISLSPTRAAATTFNFCVKNTGTAIFRTATDDGEAKDFDIVNFFGSSPLAMNENCHSYTIGGNSGSSQVKLRIFGDTTPEASEMAILELRNPPNGVAISSTAGTATYTITNDDGAAPTITISGGSAVTEGTGAQFTVNASTAPSVNLPVYLDVSDDGTSDFVAADDEGRKTVTILANQTSATYTVNTASDNTDEPNGSVTVTVAAVEEGYTVGSTSSATVTVNDDDDPAPLPVITIAGGNAVTEGTAASFTLTASPVPAATLSVNVNVSESEDFVASSDEGRKTVDIGTSGSATYTVSTDNDNTAEANGSVTVTVNTGTGYTVGNQPSATATVTVNDNDTRDLVLNPTSLSVNEGSSANYTVKLATKPTGTVTVTVGGTGRGITVDTDSGTGGNQSTLTFNPSGSNLWNTAQTVTVSAAPDNNTANESVTLTHTTSGGDYGANSVSKTLTVTATDTTPPTLSLSLASTSGNEGNSGDSDVNITISLSPTRAAATTFNFCVKNTGTGIFRTATNDGEARDFDLRTGNGTQRSVDANNCSSVTLAANFSSGRIGRLRIFGDTTPEASETAILELRNPPNGVLVSSTAGTATYTITNDDGAAPTITITGGSAVTEGTGAQFTVNASMAPSVNLPVYLDVSDDDSSDFVAAGDEGRKTVTILASQTSATYTVNTVSDNTDEPNGSVTVTVAAVEEGYTVGSTSSATVTVNDDDDPAPLPVITIAGGNEVTEGTAASFTLTASPVPAATLSVNVNVSESEDFVASSDEGRKTVDIGTSGSATYTISTDNDNTAEANGSVTVTVNTGTGYTVSSTSSSAIVTVNDNDTRDLVLNPASLSVNEGNSANYTVKLATKPTGTVTVTVGGTGSGITVDTDSGTDGNQSTLTFNPSGSNLWNTAQTVTVSAAPDSNTANESVTLTHTTSGGDYGTNSVSKTLTVTATDTTPPTLSLSLASTSGNEGDSSNSDVDITISLSPTRAAATTFNFCVKNTGTAIFRTATDDGEARDFDLRTGNGTQRSVDANNCSSVTLAANFSSGRIGRLRIFGDTTPEASETAILELRNPPNGVAISSTAGTATYTITNDDGTSPTITIAGDSAVTEGTGAQFTVNASPAPSKDLLVQLDVSDDDSSDFVAADDEGRKTVTILANQTSATYTVSTDNDNTDEPNGSVTVTVNTGTGYTVSSTSSSATVAVNDDDVSNLVISENGLSITEGGTGSYTVRLAAEPTGTVTVAITSDNGDVTVSPASLTFHASGGSKSWNMAQTVTVSVGQDADADEDSVTLIHTASGGGYDGVTTASVPVTVGDDEATPTTPPTTPTTPTPPPTAPPAPTPVVSISAGAPSVTEGDGVSFTLSATPPPEAGATITVNINVAEDGSVAASGQTGGRQVAISASGMASFTVATDDDTIYEPDGSITATVQAGAGYRPHASNASAAVSVKDNDPGLELSTSNLRVSKGGSISYTIALATQPSGPVRVSISGHEATGLTADATSLDFTPTNWDVPQPITLTAPGKAASITLTHAATGGNYGGIEAEVVVTVIALDPKARQGWLSRFGRTVSHQVVEGIQDRFTAAPPPPGLHLTVAGEALSSTTPLAENQQVLAKALGFETVTTQQLVEGSSFSFAPSADGTPAQFAIWGQGALASFSGAEESLSLDGDVSTALLGAEWSAARWLAGAALSHSWGSGDYAEDNTVAGGDISSSTLTGIFPYGRYRLTPRLGIWAITGYGWGDLTLEPDGDGTDYSPGTTMTMGAVGVDGLLLDGGAEGLSLTTTADALTVQTTSEAVADLASSDANISRLRLGLEATRPVPLANGALLLPSLELGIRQDRGDAETGFGMELAAGLAWTDPERGISAALKGRTLLTHTEEEFREQGLAISFAWEPSPSNRGGPSLALSHTMGATAEGGMDALLSPTAMEILDVTPSRHNQFETKLAYGFPAFNERLTLTPGVGLALSPDSITYSLLWALAPYAQQSQGEPWQISLEGERQEDNTADSPVEHSLKLRFSLPF